MKVLGLAETTKAKARIEIKKMETRNELRIKVLFVLGCISRSPISCDTKWHKIGYAKLHRVDGGHVLVEKDSFAIVYQPKDGANDKSCPNRGEKGLFLCGSLDEGAHDELTL